MGNKRLISYFSCYISYKTNRCLSFFVFCINGQTLSPFAENYSIGVLSAITGCPFVRFAGGLQTANIRCSQWLRQSKQDGNLC